PSALVQRCRYGRLRDCRVAQTRCAGCVLRHVFGGSRQMRQVDLRGHTDDPRPADWDHFVSFWKLFDSARMISAGCFLAACRLWHRMVRIVMDEMSSGNTLALQVP